MAEGSRISPDMVTVRLNEKLNAGLYDIFIGRPVWPRIKTTWVEVD